MYELTCPSCSHVTAASFIRVGAVVDCAACGHRYRIADAHVKRKVAGPVQTDAAGEPTFAQTMAQPAASRRVNPDGSVVGLSGLSEMMRQVGSQGGSAPHAGKGAGDVSLPPPPPAATVATALSGSKLRLNRMKQRVRQRRTQSIYILSGIMGITLIFFIGIFLLITRSPTPPETDPTVIAGNGSGNTDGQEQVPPLDPNDPDHPATVEQLPTIRGKLWQMGQWQEIQQPYEPEPMLIPAAWLSDITRVIDADGQQIYMASVVTDQPGIAVELEMTLSLVNPRGTELARAVIPVGPVSTTHTQPIRVTLPQVWLNQGGLPTPGNAKVIEHHPPDQAGFIEPEIRETRLLQQVVRHRVRIKNTLEHPIHRAVIIIRGKDSRSRPAARWRVDWDQLIEPGEYAQFWVQLDRVDQRWQILSWSLDAIGCLPEPVEPTQELPTAEADEVDPLDLPTVDPSLDAIIDPEVDLDMTPDPTFDPEMEPEFESGAEPGAEPGTDPTLNSS